MSKLSRILFFVLAFLLVWSFLNPNKQTETLNDDVIIKADSKIAVGQSFVVEIQNRSANPITLPQNCPGLPLTIERYENGEWLAEEAQTNGLSCDSEAVTISPSENYMVSLTPWSHLVFDDKGRYRISLSVNEGDDKQKIYSSEVEVGGRGFFRILWEEGFYKPIFNTLIFLISVQPGKNLGWAIIILTVIIKLLLLAPNHKALKAQKQMQKVQPQLDALKKKYANNQQKLAEETMKIWKKHKVNPASSCLPMLIQFPILIALFYVVKDGLDFINPQLLYASLKGFDASLINPVFIGLIDLTKVNIFALPVIIGGLQFYQMRLTLGKNLKNQPADSPMPMMNKTMMYFMPVLIAVFTASLPAAVGFYWGTSTLFGIAQQVVVNRSND